MAATLRQLARHTGGPFSRSLFSTATHRQQPQGNTAPAKKEPTTAPKSATEIPGPKIYPLLGSLPSLITDKNYTVATVDKLWASMVDRYGPIVRMVNPGMGPVILLYDPYDIEALNKATVDDPHRPPLASLKKLRDEITDDYFEKKTGLLNEQSSEWWRVRSRVQTPMMKLKKVEMYLEGMDHIAQDFLERIAYLQAKHGEMPEDFQEEFYKWAFETVGLIAFERRLGCLDPDQAEDSEPFYFIKIVNTMFENLAITEMGVPLWKFYPTASYKKVKESHQIFLELADRNINETLTRLDAEGETLGKETMTRELGLMETLLVTPGLTKKDVVTFILDMLFAGIDTTSHTTAFTLYLLAKNPAAQQRLQEEVDTVLKGHKGCLTKAHLAQMSYLKAVIKETFRIFPLTFGLARTTHRDTVIRGYNIPAESMVICLNMLLGKDENIYTRATEFLPERWLRDRPLGPIHPYASLPFGIGTRMCIGRRIAEQEMYTFLARAMQRFTVSYQYEDIGIKTGMVFVPDKPLKFQFTERH